MRTQIIILACSFSLFAHGQKQATKEYLLEQSKQLVIIDKKKTSLKEEETELKNRLERLRKEWYEKCKEYLDSDNCENQALKALLDKTNKDDEKDLWNIIDAKMNTQRKEEYKESSDSTLETENKNIDITIPE